MHIGRSMRTLNNGNKIQLIKLVNFATWKDCTIPCSEGINIIIADNNTGKSAIPKLFETICTYKHMSREHRKSYIRLGCDTATAFIKLFNGTQFRFMFNDKQFSGAVILPDGSKCANTEESLDMFKKSLGLIVDEETGLVANILDDKKRKVLIEVDEKESANLLALMSTVPEMEQLREKTVERDLALRQKVASANLIRNNIVREMDRYNPTKLEEYREQKELLLITERSIEVISDVLQAVDEIISKPILDNVCCLDSVGLEVLSDLYSNSSTIIELVDNVCDVPSTSLKIVEDLFENVKSIDEVESYPISSQELHTLELLYNNVSSLEEVLDDKLYLNSNELNSIGTLYESIFKIGELENLTEFEKYSNQFSSLYELATSIKEVDKGILPVRELNILSNIYDNINSLTMIEDTGMSTKAYTNLLALSYRVSELQPFYSRSRLNSSSKNLETMTGLHNMVTKLLPIESTVEIEAKIEHYKGLLNIEDFKVCTKCGEIVI